MIDPTNMWHLAILLIMLPLAIVPDISRMSTEIFRIMTTLEETQSIDAKMFCLSALQNSRFIIGADDAQTLWQTVKPI